ncbi:hypothetical protein ACQY0O_005702 [Thecaphora frezii]
MVGVPMATLPLSIFETVLNMHRIVGSVVGSRLDAKRALDIAAQGHVAVRFQKRPLSHLADVYREMENGQISGRVVLDIDE